METRTCKTCAKPFEPDFGRQVNCAPCKKSDTEQKQKSRASQKAAQVTTYAEWAWDWIQKFPQQYKELTAYQNKFSAQVQEELGRKLSDDEAETLSYASVASYCFKKTGSPLVRVVSDPKGIIVGGSFYPEVIGRDLVKNTHRFGLETSATYAGLYRPLLAVLDKKFGRTPKEGSEAESARAVKADLSGTYVLPAPPQPKPDPKPGLKIQEAPAG